MNKATWGGAGIIALGSMFMGCAELYDGGETAVLGWLAWWFGGDLALFLVSFPTLLWFMLPSNMDIPLSRNWIKLGWAMGILGFAPAIIGMAPLVEYWVGHFSKMNKDGLMALILLIPSVGGPLLIWIAMRSKSKAQRKKDFT